ncbi:MAG: YbhB/YbcL family Raf kinase inhibitor-like protein [Planctomycetota bacterium]|nr:YbhB/YbcL family Raf kinase inhibitor-like protein [Planctomycetota bacterium]
MPSIAISSSVFKAGAAIPRKHTGEDKDVSPPLQWAGVPKEAKELALICDDPDAPRAEPWVHWVLYGIPADATGLAEAIPAVETLKDPPGARQGTSDFGRIGYGGPMPPKGHGTHHYHLKLYALDAALDLKPGLTKKKLLEAIKGHVVAEGELVGTYERK